MLGSAVETGVIDHIEGTTLHLSRKTEKAAQSVQPDRSTYAGTHYLQIYKGPRAGYHADLAGGDDDTLRTTHDLSSLIKPGDAYQIRPYVTLSKVLGPQNQAARLQAAANFDQADQIYIPDPQSGELAAYYFRHQPDGQLTLAHRDGRPVATDPILYPGSGFMISRIAEQDTYITQTGNVQTHAAIIPIETGVNFIASTFPVDTTLAGFFGPQARGLAEQDTVHLPREFGLQDQYRLAHSANGPHWLPLGDAPPADKAKIPAGSVVILHRQGEPFNLRLERPFDL
jgi:hypothetical protein